MNPEEVKAMIEAGLPNAQIQVQSEDNVHFSTCIVSPQFEGKRMIQRHQMVYATLGVRMGREIHALSIEAHTPQEYQSLVR
jgi:acid stress-induced BolA-like protein IbaG/YrbA